MSPGARIAIGIVTAFSAFCFVLIGAVLGPELPAGALPFYGMAAFCAIVSMACLMSQGRAITLRVIGISIFVTFAFFAYTSFGKPDFGRAIAAFVVFGFPAAFLAITGNYPRWGRAAAAFDEPDLPQAEASTNLHGGLSTMGRFDLAKMNIFGWLLLVGSFAVAITGAFLTVEFRSVLDLPNTRATQVALACLILAVAIGFFFAGRLTLKWIGITIYRRS